MALSIKTDKADRLARELVAATGETMTRAVETALEERLARLRRAETTEQFVARVNAFLDESHRRYGLDRRPMTQAEADWAGGDDAEAGDHPFR